MSGDNKAVDAIKQAMDSPLLETTVSGASDIIVNFSGNVGIVEAYDAITFLTEQAGDEANIIFGTVDNDQAGEDVSITIIATGLEEEPHGTRVVVPSRQNKEVIKTTSFSSEPVIKTPTINSVVSTPSTGGIKNPTAKTGKPKAQAVPVNISLNQPQAQPAPARTAASVLRSMDTTAPAAPAPAAAPAQAAVQNAANAAPNPAEATPVQKPDSAKPSGIKIPDFLRRG